MLVALTALFAMDGCTSYGHTAVIEAQLPADVVRSVVRNRADLCESGFEQVCIAVTPVANRTPPFDVGMPEKYCVTAAMTAVDTATEPHCEIPLRFLSDASRFVRYGYENPDWQSLGRVVAGWQHRRQGSPVVPLALLHDVRIGSIRYPAERPGIAVVEWTAEVSFAPTYRRWFARVASGADVRLDALRYHVRHKLGIRRSSFVHRDGFWFYDDDRNATVTPATVIWDRQAIVLRRIAVGSCVLLFAISLACIVLSTYLRRIAVILRRKLNPGFGRLVFVGAACVLTSGVGGYWRTHIDMRSDDLILYHVPGLPRMCALSWGELLPPCNYTIAKALGFRGSDQVISIHIDYLWAPPLLSKSPAQPIQCASSRVDHVGNGMTAFVLSNRHLYYTYAIFEEPDGREAALIRSIRTDSSVASCLDADERQFLKVGDGFVEVRQLWR